MVPWLEVPALAPLSVPSQLWKVTSSLMHSFIRKNFFPLRVMEPWPRLPREVVESPSLEIFKTHLDVVLCSLLWVGRGLDWMTHRGPCQPLTFCDSVIPHL